MTQLLPQIVLSNAVAAAILAVLVWAVGLVVKRPALMRALWVIVLLKLLTPPVWSIPVRMPTEKPAPSVVAVRVEEHPSAIVSVDAAPEQPVIAEIRAEPPAIEPQVSAATHVSWEETAIIWLARLWLAGSSLLLAITIIRLLSLRQLLRHARPAPADVQEQAAGLAARLGLGRAPAVWLVPGPVCPALWAFSRYPKVLVPFGLWSGLDERQRQTLLAHELAHLRRRDHWVRLIESLCVVLWWWHPAVWWARRQIHDFEEQCCDAWVLWAVPSSARSYGDALLATVEFVSMYRPMRPALSAGLGEFNHLKRRLLMIRQGQVARAMSRTGLLAVCGTGMSVLSIGPVLGQEAPAVAPPAVVEVAPAPQADPAPPVALPRMAVPEGAMTRGRDEMEAGKAAVAQARAQVLQLRAQLSQAMASLRMAEARLKLLEQGGAAGALPQPADPFARGSGFGGGGTAFGGVGGGFARGGAMPPAPTLPAPAPATPPAAGMPGAMGGYGMMRGMPGQPPAAGMAGGYGGFGGGGVGSAPPPAGAPAPRATSEEQERRLDAMERQLGAIMKELHDLKRESNSRHSQPADPHESKTAPEPQPTPELPPPTARP